MYLFMSMIWCNCCFRNKSTPVFHVADKKIEGSKLSQLSSSWLPNNFFKLTLPNNFFKLTFSGFPNLTSLVWQYSYQSHLDTFLISQVSVISYSWIFFLFLGRSGHNGLLFLSSSLKTSTQSFCTYLSFLLNGLFHLVRYKPTTRGIPRTQIL